MRGGCFSSRTIRVAASTPAGQAPGSTRAEAALPRPRARHDRLPARPPPNLEGGRDLVGPGFRPVEPCAEVVLCRRAEERKPQPTAQPAGQVVSTLPDAVLGRPSGRVIGCA